MALIDTGSTISALTEGFCTEIGLRIHSTEEFVRGCAVSQGDGVF